MRWSFTPDAGKTYLLRAVGQPTLCSAALFDMTDVDRIRPASSAVRRNTADKPCVPLALARDPGTAAESATSEDAVLREGQGADDLKGLIQP